MTNTIMAAPDALLGAVKIGYIFYTNWLKIQIIYIIFYLWIYIKHEKI